MDYWVGERCTTWWKRAVLLGRREVEWERGGLLGGKGLCY